MKDNARIAIIGAGIAGLGAGYRLKKAILEPVIFEQDSFAGGRMSSEKVEGFIVDKGAYTIPESHKFILELVKELGLSKHIVKTPGSSSTFVKGLEHKMKIGSPKDFLQYKLLGLKDKKNLMKLFVYAQALGRTLSLSDPTEKTFKLEQETVSDYLLREYSPEILEYIAYPIFADLFLGVPEENSKAALLSTLQNLTRFKIYTLSQGMGMVVDKLEDLLDIRLNTPVLKIHHDNTKNIYIVEVGGKNPGAMEFDDIILAIPLPMVPKLFYELPESLKDDLDIVKYTPSITVAMGMAKPYSFASLMNVLVRKEFETIATVVLDHHKGGERIPPEKGLSTAILTAGASHRLLNEPDSAVTEAVLEEMDSLWRGFTKDLLFTRVYRWKHGGVQLPPGTLKSQVSLREKLESHFHNIAFAGDGLYRASLEVSLRTGYKAADRILANARLNG